MTAITHRLRTAMIGVMAAVVAAFGITATTGTALAASKHHSKHHSRHHSTRHHKPTHHSTGIPQGNVGDNDADNHGGPSDGDGNI
jgi:hypothetical protein